MENPAHHDAPTPPDCFLLEEVQALQSFEKQVLDKVNYYVWHNQEKPGAQPHRFLYAVEFVFKTGESLLLSSGEDSTAIHLITAEQLLDVAHKLQQLHKKAIVQRVVASAQPLWRDVVGTVLQNFRLSRNEAGLYLNDAVLLDFGERRVLLRLSDREGLLAGEY